jgi:ABC-type multidrug transport system fused ATPase/permease subunit
MVLSSAGSLVSPYILKIVIDEVIPSGSFSYLLHVMLILTFVNLMRIAISFWSDRLYVWISSHIVLDLRKDLFNHLIRLRISFFDQNETGNIVYRINSEVNSVQNMLTGSMVRFVNSFLTIVGLSIALSILNFGLFVISMIVVPFIIVNIRYFQPRIEANIKLIQERESRILNFFIKRFDNIRLIKSFVNYDFESDLLVSEIKKLIKLNLSNVNLSSTTRSVSTFLIALSPVLIFIWGGKEVMTNEMSLGSLVAFIQYLNRLFNPIRELMSLYWDIIRSTVSMRRIFEFMDEPIESIVGKNLANRDETSNCLFKNKAQCFEKINLNEKLSIKDSIKFQNVYFKYDDNWILNNLSLELKRGKKYAIVGPSGCGKSTIASLLNQFYEPQQGYIRFDDNQIQSINLDNWRKGIAFVEQDNQLIRGTILDDIKYGNLNASEEELKEVFEICGIDKTAFPLLSEVESNNGQSGLQLSSGQVQRLAIARAILKDSEVILLDEATSALDSKSEKLIFQKLAELHGSKTLIVISHRVSTLKNVDEILHLEEGNIVESGTYDELVNKKGYFWELFKEQIEFVERGRH